jgi:7,8-dihydroneopterin aldolase/epimerase/oxygenase
MSASSGSLPQLTIVVKDLEIPARIGIYDHEKAGKQPLIFDVEVKVLPPVDDTIGSTVDYDEIVAALQRVADRNHHGLLETMAKNICEELFRESRVQGILIRIVKPMAIKQARSAGVVWSMQRPAPRAGSI